MKTQTKNAGIKILVVEDSRTQAEYLCHILENEGYSVAIAANGNDALDQIRIDRPGVVLTDILMPGMDGYALCRAIKQDKDTADIPVILVTQLFEPADLVKGLEAGADNIIIKPFEAGHVRFRLASTLKLQDPPGDAGSALEVSLDGQLHSIHAHPSGSPAILLSSYDLVVRKNAELQKANEHLTAVNADLLQAVDNLQKVNEALQRVNAGLMRREQEQASGPR